MGTVAELKAFLQARLDGVNVQLLELSGNVLTVEGVVEQLFELIKAQGNVSTEIDALMTEIGAGFDGLGASVSAIGTAVTAIGEDDPNNPPPPNP